MSENVWRDACNQAGRRRFDPEAALPGGSGLGSRDDGAPGAPGARRAERPAHGCVEAARAGLVNGCAGPCGVSPRADPA